MASHKPSSLARRLSLALAGAAAVLLSGCVMAPIGPYDVGAPVAYPAYGNYPVYGAPTYYGWPYWGGPAVSLNLYGRVGGGHRSPPPRWNRRGHGGGHWAPGSRPPRGSFSGGGRQRH